MRPAYVPSSYAQSSFDPSAEAQQTGWGTTLPSPRQDRLSVLAPLAAVLLFLAAVIAAFAYLRVEELERERDALRRDVEYAQQRLRLKLLERQEQSMRLARELSNQEIDAEEFIDRAESLVHQNPELQVLTWIDGNFRVRASYASANLPSSQLRVSGRSIADQDTVSMVALARDLQQPVYSQPLPSPDGSSTSLQLHVPITRQGRFAGVVLSEYSVEALLRYAVPTEVSAKYATALLDDKGQVLAGHTVDAGRNRDDTSFAWLARGTEYEVPVSPVGNSLVLRAQGYRTSPDLVGSGLFWLMFALSSMTAWMLIANWQHTRRRTQAQQALMAETNFRRAMENSMPTGMRALDPNGRITYVNAAFCQMTGWAESELVGCVAPFPYWPPEHRQELAALLADELAGHSPPGGFQVRVQRRDGTQFDARLYVSPLVDARGRQTGWMTSMTDITEPNRIREQLQASHERFTTVLEALDASVSVAPLDSGELLFANKLYRQWFGGEGTGHLQMLAQAGVPGRSPLDETLDDVDAYAGLPAGALTEQQAENAELYVPQLGQWLEVRSRYLQWVDGRLAQMVIASDISPRRRAEEQAAAQTERAQTASRLITMGEMASSVAHELNQPLTAIANYCNGMSARLNNGQINTEELLAALDKTTHQAQRAGQIIQRIRSFVKRSEPNHNFAAVATMVGEALELAGIELKKRNVRLISDVAAGLPALRVDPILIEQVLINLLKNAAESVDSAQRSIEQRHVHLQVTRALVEGQDVVEFAVTDNGRGLAPDVIPRLYEAFFSTKAEGMGMGLNLCRTIVESHQGRMQAANLYNGELLAGCRFSFWIPVQQAALASAAPQAAGVSA